MATEKLDLYKENRDQYKQTKTPILLQLPAIPYLTINGHGKPADSAFEARVGALYGMTYAIKFMCKNRGQDFVVAKLEGLWHPEQGFEKKVESPTEMIWDYKLMIRVPEFVEKADLTAARELLEKKTKEGPHEDVQLESIHENTVVQALHVGPYPEEQATIDAMHAFAEREGFQPMHGHHEIYLSDPRRVEPEELKTLLRTPVKRAQ